MGQESWWRGEVGGKRSGQPLMVMANDIPVARTPEGGWKGDMPSPILSGCTEVLHPDAPDLRRLWNAFLVEREGRRSWTTGSTNMSNRVVVTSEGVIHDMRADGTLENGVDDVAGADFTQRIRVAAVFNGGRLDLHPFGVDPSRPPLVTREVVGGDLVWNYGSFTVTMRRIDAAIA